ncbi:MAG: substrate-binding domain-containing protein [Opitutales bacterium]
MPSPSRIKTIGVFVRLNSTVKRDVVQAIARAAGEQLSWECLLLTPPGFEKAFEVPSRVNGILAWPDGPGDADILCASGRPAVFLGQVAAPAGAAVDRVMLDNDRVGRIMAKFFLAKGFRSFTGFRDRTLPVHLYANRRWRGFVDRLEESGISEPTWFDGHKGSESPEAWLAQLPALGRWLKALAPGTAVFCERDRCARDLCTACAHFDIDVPGHVSILGVGNDDVLCGFGRPPLSSLDLDGDRAGRLAVEILAHRLRAPRAKPRMETLQHFNIVERASTDRIAVEDPEVREALHTIREHIPGDIDVESLSRELGYSRRSLEKRFQAALGHGPHREILLARIEHAKKLLRESQKPIAEISDLCGFSEPRRLSEVFAREVGVSPRAWRNPRDL